MSRRNRRIPKQPRPGQCSRPRPPPPRPAWPTLPPRRPRPRRLPLPRRLGRMPSPRPWAAPRLRCAVGGLLPAGRLRRRAPTRRTHSPGQSVRAPRPRVRAGAGRPSRTLLPNWRRGWAAPERRPPRLARRPAPRVAAPRRAVQGGTTGLVARIDELRGAGEEQLRASGAAGGAAQVQWALAVALAPDIVQGGARFDQHGQRLAVRPAGVCAAQQRRSEPGARPHRQQHRRRPHKELRAAQGTDLERRVQHRRLVANAVLRSVPATGAGQRTAQQRLRVTLAQQGHHGLHVVGEGGHVQRMPARRQLRAFHGRLTEHGKGPRMRHRP
eukprot:scaffold16206_cov134-Isochrysis_galbana.AAC.6